jgi:hypothetical protein
MAKKSVRKSTKQLAPEARGKQSTGAYPVEPDELEAQQRRLKKAAAAGAEGLTSTVPAPTPDLHPAPTMALSKPLTPLAALWPKPTASAGAGQPLKLPAQAKSLEKATVAQVPTPPASPRVKVNFVLPAPAAKHVSLSGEFNGWSPEATAMGNHPRLSARAVSV